MKTGTLYIIATPIGNLGDISLRALEILKQVDSVAAEDTRHSGKLLAHFNIKKPLFSLHNYNEQERSKKLLSKLEHGESIALISDAGTPLISDPGFKLVNNVQSAGIKIVPIPGACAAITALSVSGLPTDKFVFEGFLPAKTTARCKRLQELKPETRTLILYESPHRLMALIVDMHEVLEADRIIVLARELTKKFETIKRGTVKEIKIWLEADANQQKGEFVVLVHGAIAKEQEINPEVLKILQILRAELPPKKAAALTAKITGANKNQLYGV